MQAANLKIGDLARLAGCGVETVRHYEREGLLPTVARTSGNYRLYGEAHVQRLRFIRRCRALGMSQDEVRTLLDLQSRPGENCEAVDACVTAHIRHVEHRITE
ncbi:MerR family transcriptional regulator [Viridibacterium curvum]|uniref:HTH merR-type domain-containing protein n=1 Tax=Viridibacterium curvum TaxID=1101404 RepID=A0ABP9QR81_9RHOO